MNKFRRLSDFYRFPSQKEPMEVLEDVKKIFSYSYPEKEFKTVEEVFFDVLDLFNGKMKGYRACNTMYHDIHHTMSAFNVMSQLIDGYNLSHEYFSVDEAKIGLISALLHDSGYIQKANETIGTGAQYTLIHPDRSIEFMSWYLKERYFPKKAIRSIANMIRCTGLYPKISNINFGSESEKILGYMLGTADLLGQMSDPLYLEKLLFLYCEFKEGKVLGYKDEKDLLEKTIGFYEYVKELLTVDFSEVYKYVEIYFKNRLKIDKNLYFESIGNQITYLNKMLQELGDKYRLGLRRKVHV